MLLLKIEPSCVPFLPIPCVVQEWVDFMKSQGIDRVVSLLTASELETYAEAVGPALKAAFDEVLVADPKQPGEHAGCVVLQAVLFLYVRRPR